MKNSNANDSFGQNCQISFVEMSTTIKAKNDEIEVVPEGNAVIEEHFANSINQTQFANPFMSGDIAYPMLFFSLNNNINFSQNTEITATAFPLAVDLTDIIYKSYDLISNLVSEVEGDKDKKSSKKLVKIYKRTQGIRQQKSFQLNVKKSVLNENGNINFARLANQTDMLTKDFVLNRVKTKKIHKRKSNRKLVIPKAKVKSLTRIMDINQDREQSAIKTSNEYIEHKIQSNLTLDKNAQIESSEHFYDCENLILQSNEFITEKFLIMAKDLINTLEEFSRQNFSHQIYFERLIRIFKWPESFLPIKLNFNKALTRSIRQVKKFLLDAPEFAVIAMDVEHFAKYPRSLLKLYQRDENCICSNKLSYTLKLILLTASEVKYVMPFIWIETLPIISLQQSINTILKKKKAEQLTKFMLNVSIPKTVVSKIEELIEYKAANNFNNNNMNLSGIMSKLKKDLLKFQENTQIPTILKIVKDYGNVSSGYFQNDSPIVKIENELESFESNFKVERCQDMSLFPSKNINEYFIFEGNSNKITQCGLFASIDNSNTVDCNVAVSGNIDTSTTISLIKELTTNFKKDLPNVKDMTKQLLVTLSLEEANNMKVNEVLSTELNMSHSSADKDEIALFVKANNTNNCTADSIKYEYNKQDTLSVNDGLVEIITTNRNDEVNKCIDDVRVLAHSSSEKYISESENTFNLKEIRSTAFKEDEKDRITDNVDYILQFRDKFVRACKKHKAKDPNFDELHSLKYNFMDPYKLVFKNEIKEAYNTSKNDSESKNEVTLKYQANEYSSAIVTTSEDTDCYMTYRKPSSVLPNIILQSQVKHYADNVSCVIDEEAANGTATSKLTEFLQSCKLFTPLEYATRDIIDFIIFSCLHIIIFGILFFFKNTFLFGINRQSTTVYFLPIIIKLSVLAIKYLLLSILMSIYRRNYCKSIAQMVLSNNEVWMTKIKNEQFYFVIVFRSFMQNKYCIIRSILKYLPWLFYIPILSNYFNRRSDHLT